VGGGRPRQATGQAARPRGQAAGPGAGPGGRARRRARRPARCRGLGDGWRHGTIRTAVRRTGLDGGSVTGGDDGVPGYGLGEERGATAAKDGAMGAAGPLEERSEVSLAGVASSASRAQRREVSLASSAEESSAS